MYNIPLSVPSINGNEWKYIKECLDTEWVSSAGNYVDEFEKKIANYTGAKYGIACVNGTSALQVSLRLVGILPGDEVIVPTISFIAPINSVVYNGASPIFMDSDKYYNIDSEKTIEFIKKQTVYKDGFTYNKITNKKISAILPVHIWGNAVWLDDLEKLCYERNIVIVEDASESLGTNYVKGVHSGDSTGVISKIGCLSFNGNKIITTGGGGMILTNDEELSNKAKYLTTQAKDDPVRYIHNEVGYNFRLTNIQAALGLAQFEELPNFLISKKNIYQRYVSALEDIDGLLMAKVPAYAENNHWMNLVQIDSNKYGMDRETLMSYLKSKGIQTRPVWALNHLQKPFKKSQSYKIDKAEELVDNSLCIPSSNGLTEIDIDNVIGALNG